MRDKARVKIRRGHGWSVRPEAEDFDGKIVTVSRGWDITDNDSVMYAGEVAYIVDNFPLGWIASGDLEFIDNER